jgi:uncharacterized protein (DUF2141 family)
MRLAHCAPFLLLPLGGTSMPGTTTIEIENARNSKGVLHICLTTQSRHFPDCSRDPAAIKRTVPATSRSLNLTGVAPGRYALTLFHDENNNQRLDTILGIPREGFGFSRNPLVRFGAPKFRQVEFQLTPGINRQTVRLQYLL